MVCALITEHTQLNRCHRSLAGRGYTRQNIFQVASFGHLPERPLWAAAFDGLAVSTPFSAPASASAELPQYRATIEIVTAVAHLTVRSER